MELKDFQPPTLSLSDFSTPARPGTNLNLRTTSQLAAASSFGQLENDMTNFRFWRSQLQTREGRNEFLLQNNLKTSLEDYYKSNVGDILVDPNIPDEEKAAVLSVVGGTSEAPRISTLELLGQQAYANDDADESQESFENRSLIVDILGPVVDIKQKQQSLVNGYRLSRDENALDMVQDFGELMVPFAEYIQISQLQTQMGLDPTQDRYLGEMKQAIKQAIQNAPMDQKLAMFQKLFDVVSNNDTVVFSDGNTLLALDVLERIAIDGEYSEAESWFDNAVTVLDAIGIGGLVASAIKTPARAARLSRFEREAAAFRGARDPSANQVFSRFEKDDVVVNQPSALELEAQAFKPETPTPSALEREAAEFVPETTPESEALAAEAMAWMVRTDVDPTSPSQVFKEVSPQSARGAHTAAAEDATGEAAQALYGTSREEALAKDLLPEPDTTGVMPVKVVQDGPVFPEDETIKGIRNRDGNAYITDNEVGMVREKIVRGLEDIEGMVPHKESMTIRLNDDGSTTYRMMYRPKDSGFKTASRAMENALYAFSDYGLTEKNIVLLQRTPKGYEPVDAKVLQGKAILREELENKRANFIPPELQDLDYAVAIDFTHKFNPNKDIVEGTWDVLYSKRNWFDMLPAGPMVRTRQGSLNSHIFDPNSVLPTEVIEPASALVDRALALRKAYVEMITDNFLVPFDKLNEERKFLIDEYIKEANLNQIKFSEVDLRARGFNGEEVNILKEWRRAMDTLWWGNNADAVKSARNRGYQLFKDGYGSKLVAKPVSRNQVGQNTVFYNTDVDMLETMDKLGLDDFYAKGGTLARLHEPIEINGEWVDMLKVPNTPEKGYLRQMNDDDILLHYVDGYYPVVYDGNWFLTKTVKGRNGEEFKKTIASSKREADILRVKKQLEAEEPDAVFRARADRRNNQQRFSQMSEDGWNYNVSSGMSAQRIRGQRLIDASVDLHKVGNTNILDPLEATAMQIAQLSQRVMMRDYLDTVKSRWISSYFDEIQLEPNKYGEKWFPSDFTQISRPPGVKFKTVADARSMYNYIYHLENGYINGIDEVWKAVFNFSAEFFDTLGLGKTSDALQTTARTSPSSVSKAAAFKVYLAANPQRQLLLQAHQAVQLQAVNPKYFYGPLQWDLYRISKAARGDTSDVEATHMLEEIVKSGLLEAVDANNLVRSDVLQLAARTNAQKLAEMANKPIAVSQKYGFDLGEQIVNITSWLTHYDLKIKEKGNVLTRRDLDQVAGKARAYTYNMNRAGTMPYHENTMSVIAQFLMVPHKAIMQMFTNRSLTRWQRLKLLGFNTIMYGVPSWIVAQTWMKPGPERDAIEAGLEDILLNGVAEFITGEEQQVDFSALSPINAYGLYQTVTSMAVTDPWSLIAESPAGSLVFGENARLKEAFRTGARYFNFIDDYNDPENQTKITDVAKTTLQIFSGASNSFKTRYAFEIRQKISANGNVTDEDITVFEAGAQFFGLGTKTETSRNEIYDLLSDGRPYEKDDVGLWYAELKRHLVRRGMSPQEADFQRRVLSEAWRVFKLDEPFARATIQRLIEEDVNRGDFTFHQGLLRQMGRKEPHEVRELINKLPPSRERNMLLESVDRYEASRFRAQKVQEQIDLQEGSN